MGILETYNYYYEMSDPRVENWFLVGSLWPISLILFSYLYFVFQCGPRYMENRPAYKFKNFIRVYNIFQVIANAYIVNEIWEVYPDLTVLQCIPIDYSTTPGALRIVKACYYSTMLKVVDLIETGLFVLRKKNNQISFLHVYHHITTVLVGVVFVRYVSGGMAVLFPALNGAVHVIMYSYYFLSSIEGIKDVVLPLKRYVTIIQMVQFVIFLLHLLIALSPSCPVPKFPVLVMIPNVLLNFTLFYNFYKKAYLNSKTKK
ncbi:elongation of very long chain fatty acids protein 4-like [Belonocnema kinseyi]|uniref:elongation of very long chain fatty acids protein 4-like n=1 Tax=Belonocnema kinseyi TaxID=2817044 RepID=UPI00143D2E3C|nr:elongation of very long chain fatty acids protein 4-like [Belonocnema kinseyi]